jgi:hypothetical protein
MAETNTTSGQSGAATKIADRVRERANAQLTSQKERATDGLGSVAQAVRQSTQQLRDQHHETVASYVEQAAEQLERLSHTLKQKDISELFNDAQRLARRQPALFIGSAFAIGLLGARFFKSSAPEEDQMRRRPFTENPEYRAARADPYGTGAAHGVDISAPETAYGRTERF